MTLELHVLGPAFGLPSIDPDCIALIALLSLPLTKDLEWKLVIAHDSSQSPTGDFPLLKHNGQIVAGFRPIVRHLQHIHNDVDDDLTENQRATVTGIIAHLRLKAQPLVDAHLYADTQNYIHATRPAFSAILPFPLTWITPPHRAERAVERSSHLANQTSSILPFSRSGPSSNQDSQGPGALQATSSPSLLFARSEKARLSLAQQVSAVRLRLHSAADALCEPLAELLALDNDRRGGLWLIRGKLPTSADCLAYGYLSLLLEPEVPNTAVSETLNERWPRVVQYYQTLKGVLSLDKSARFAIGSHDIPVLSQDEAVYSTRHHASSLQGLPWFREKQPGIIQRAAGILQMILNAIIAPESQRRLNALIKTRSIPLLAGLATGSSLGAVSIAYAVFTLSQKGRPGGMPRIIVFAAERAVKTSAGRFGEAGAMLGLLQ